MSKTLAYSSFVIASLVVIVAFVTATTYAQLAVAIVLYPLLVYFAFKVLPRKTWKAPVVTIRLPVTPKPKKEDGGITNIDKRTFLKLIGAAGLSLFLYSIFFKKAQIPFFGSNKVEATEKQPTEGYRITEIDDSVVAYYGFTNKDGAWFIMREDTDTGSFRYSKGDLNFTSGWTNREHLKYDYYYKLF